MIWLFERDQRVVRVETRLEGDPKVYVLAIVWADGRSETQSFVDSVEFAAKVHELEQQLAADAWKQVGPPTLLPPDWRRF